MRQHTCNWISIKRTAKTIVLEFVGKLSDSFPVYLDLTVAAISKIRQSPYSINQNLKKSDRTTIDACKDNGRFSNASFVWGWCRVLWEKIGLNQGSATFISQRVKFWNAYEGGNSKYSLILTYTNFN